MTLLWGRKETKRRAGDSIATCKSVRRCRPRLDHQADPALLLLFAGKSAISFPRTIRADGKDDS
jgi:hypothetical protein